MQPQATPRGSWQGVSRSRNRHVECRAIFFGVSLAFHDMAKKTRPVSAPHHQPASDPAATAARYAFYTVVVTSLVAPVVNRLLDAWLK